MTKYEKDQIVTGYVTGIEPYGIFVNLDEQYEGLIHISEISNNYVRNISTYVCLGEEIKMKVLEVNKETRQVKLSIKDIDYRDEQKSRIKPTKKGFSTLEKKLPLWISEKIEEINNKKGENK